MERAAETPEEERRNQERQERVSLAAALCLAGGLIFLFTYWKRRCSECGSAWAMRGHGTAEKPGPIFTGRYRLWQCRYCESQGWRTESEGGAGGGT